MQLLKRLTLLTLLLAVFGMASASVASELSSIDLKNHTEEKLSSFVGEAVIRVVSNASSTGFLSGPGYAVVDSIPELRAYLVEFFDVKPAPGLIQNFRRNPNVDFIEPNEARDIPEMLQVSIGFPDQARPIFTLGTEPTNYYEQPGTNTTGVEAAQALATGEGVTIAVIDNGIDYSHPLLQTVSVGPGYDFVDDDADPSEGEGLMFGHGTFVSGLIWLTAPNCTILPIRAFDGDGRAKDFTIAKAMVWALQHDVDVANLSFGAPVSSGLMTVAAGYLLGEGVSLVAAAGNEGNADNIYPAAVPGVIAVTSMDETEHRASWANYGPYLTLIAPGVNLYSALASEFEWGTWSGTSFSAPLVTGTVALMLERNSTLDPGSIYQQLVFSAREELLWGTVATPSEEYGYGALDVYRAVSSLTSGDIDGNGVVDGQDLATLIAFVAGDFSDPESDFAWFRADMNSDGILNLTDITLLARYVTGTTDRVR